MDNNKTIIYNAYSMKKTVWFCEFTDAFRDAWRQDSFTYEGKKALYDYLTQYEEDTWTEIEIDAIAIDCDFTEYAYALEAASNYFEFEGMTFWENWEELETREQVEEKAKEFLRENTTLIEFKGGIIINNF